MSSILITGGTGTFGRAFIKTLLASNQYQRIIVYSRSEHAQADMAAELADHSERVRFFIGDVRDVDRLRRAFQGVRVIVHAAALKRIEVGHYNPDEMVKTNVLGTMNVIEAALSTSVETVVGLSSDKAWQPISPYGQSKALAETLLLNANNIGGLDGPKFNVVRYGNVAGSNGSVIPKWRKLISEGKPIQMSDPDCTRFWMTIDEAVNLVLAAINSERNSLLIPKLPAYRLGDLAEAMGAEHISVTGLPPWEKKHEGMDFGNTSDVAPRMTIYELAVGLRSV